MPLYRIDGKKLKSIKEKSFSLEKDLQKITEDNLDILFGLEFVQTEFQLNSRFIDTLAFNPETRAFVIIEYKKDKSLSVIDQGYAYLSLMLSNKGECILEYNEQKDKTLHRKDIDWTQSKVMFISPYFTPYQVEAINFKDLPIELWEVGFYENQTISYAQRKSVEKVSIKEISKGGIIESVSKEVKKYTLEDHLQSVRGDHRDIIKDIFISLDDQITEIDNDIKQEIGKSTIYYKISGLTFAYFWFQKTQLSIDLRLPKSTKELYGIAIIRDLKEGDPFCVNVKISLSKDINRAVELIRQAYENVVSNGSK